jgi:hypothetical protein
MQFMFSHMATLFQLWNDIISPITLSYPINYVLLMMKVIIGGCSDEETQ